MPPELARTLPDDVDDVDGEIERRIDAIDDGTAKTIPWEQAREMILRDE